ncbi:hypothetical protein AAFF_G00283950 [Aldrovandia affinis]|uniref:Uncharacterized protein n=1 Tax=Aldrovandia affinis TaxID=143900 RepID=A0AAD7TBB7_9TELE|nr:hypothetical protein AAFF_G00283950 [Aldrovandia affinis]
MLGPAGLMEGRLHYLALIKGRHATPKWPPGLCAPGPVTNRFRYQPIQITAASSDRISTRELPSDTLARSELGGAGGGSCSCPAQPGKQLWGLSHPLPPERGVWKAVAT